ncbi:unnamed protein product [Meloidogyne enterolobii]|uniref:Uncharacterized protein n=1 Tax=Meloidogyne enterolobii TaxID=390850 RepID=A0ACB1AGQ3_MELEN
MVYVHVQTYGYAQFFGLKPQLVHCPTCDQNTKTKLKYVVRSDAWLNCICIALMGFFTCLFSIYSLVHSITRGDTSLTAICFICLIFGFIYLKILLKKFFRLLFFAFSSAPFYWNHYKNVEHYCSACDTYIGKHVRDIRRPIVILPPESYKNLPIRQ